MLCEPQLLARSWRCVSFTELGSTLNHLQAVKSASQARERISRDIYEVINISLHRYLIGNFSPCACDDCIIVISDDSDLTLTKLSCYLS